MYINEPHFMRKILTHFWVNGRGMMIGFKHEDLPPIGPEGIKIAWYDETAHNDPFPVIGIERQIYENGTLSHDVGLLIRMTREKYDAICDTMKYVIFPSVGARPADCRRNIGILPAQEKEPPE